MQESLLGSAEHFHVPDDLDIPTDAESTVMLLRDQLYPDPAAAAAAAAAAKKTTHAKRSKAAPGPSVAAAKTVVAAAAAATAARQLPRIILKSQLYTVLTDRTAADRDLEDLRRQGRARLFKLSIGADEFALLLREDYLAVLDSLIAKHQQLAVQQQQQQQSQQQQQQPAQQLPRQGSKRLREDEQSEDADNNSKGSAEHAAIAHCVQLFRDRVMPTCCEAHITRQQLLHLMKTSRQCQNRNAAAAAGAGNTVAAPVTVSAQDMQRHLLACDLVCRDRHVPDTYMFCVPGASAVVKSVLAGRQQLMQLLSRKMYQEAFEKELCCVRLRGSCLTPTFHIRDLQGRGLVTCIDTTAGRLVRLVRRK